MGKGQSSTTVTKADPWAPAQPHILQGLDSASEMWNSDPNQFVIEPWRNQSIASEDPALQASRNTISGFGYNPPTPGQYGEPAPTYKPPSVPPATPPAPPPTTPPAPPPTTPWGPPQRASVSPLSAPSAIDPGGLVPPPPQPIDPGGLVPPTQGGIPAGSMPDTQMKYLQDAQQATQGVMSAAQQGAPDAFNRSVNNATLDPMGQGIRAGIRQNVAESVMPSVNSTFGQNNMAGSSLHSAAAAKGMASGMAPYELQAANSALDRSLSAGGMAQDAQVQNRGQALRAAQMTPGMSEAQYNPLDRVGEVGKERTQQNQMQLAADIMANQQAQAGPIDAINNYLALTSGLGGQFGSSVSNSSSNPGLLGTIGGGLQGLGLLGGLFSGSDRRLKENIIKVGKTDGGLPVYTYNYIGDPRPLMGVMADEVEKVIPEAVMTHESGYKMVNYGEIR